MNPHIAEFQRFANVYLSWSHVHMDQIVADAVHRHATFVRTPSPFDPMTTTLYIRLLSGIS